MACAAGGRRAAAAGDAARRRCAHETQSPSPLAAAREVLVNPRFLLGALITMLLYSALFTWISTSPFLMIDRLGFSTIDAAIVLGLGSLGYMAAAR